MGKSIDHFWLDADDTHEKPPLLDHASHDGLLRFKYREDGPGVMHAHVHAHNTLIIPLQETPVRVFAERDGRKETATMVPGDIAVALAGAVTRWEWLDPAKVILVHINPSVMQRFMKTELKIVPLGHGFDETIFFHDVDVMRAADRMRETLEADELGSDVVFDSLARMFIVLMVQRYCNKDAPEVAFDQRFGPDQYSQVVTYIEQHLNDKLTPALLATELGMSEAAFSRKFKSKVGETPMRFVTQVRLEVASRMLAEHDKSLAQISAECGFSDQAHLSRNFKRHIGVSPSQFRAELA